MKILYPYNTMCKQPLPWFFSNILLKSLSQWRLINKKTRDLIMILNSRRFLDKLVSELEEKKYREVKLRESLKDVARRRMELQNSLSSIWPKQESALVKTRALKELCETSLFSIFDGRPVYIYEERSTHY